MPIELERTTEKNDLGYCEINALTLQPLTDFILVSWEFCQDKIKAGKFVLERPDTHKKMHYVGTIIALGPDVDPEFQIGQRIVFDQFSDFEKYWDERYGRVALLQESRQGALLAIVPERVLIEGQEPEYNFDV